MRAAAGVVVGEAGVDVRSEADVVVRPGIDTLQNVDESLVFGHPQVKATSVPTCRTQKRSTCPDGHSPRWVQMPCELHEVTRTFALITYRA